MLFGIASLLSTVSDISFFSAESRSRVLVHIAMLLQIYDRVRSAPLCIICMQPQFLIGHINEYPTMHYFGIPRHTPSMQGVSLVQ